MVQMFLDTRLIGETQDHDESLSDGFSGKIPPTSDHWTTFLIGCDFSIAKFDPSDWPMG